MARSRRFNVFSLAFLDVMSCGFGAVILIFLIINHETEEDTRVVNRELLSEIRMLDYQVQNGEKDLLELKEVLDDIAQRLSDSDQKLVTTKDVLDDRSEDLDEVEARSLAQKESVLALKSDVDSREEELRRLQAIKAARDGQLARSFEGEGDRQYLTGLRVGGRNIVIAVDASGSMLDNTIVNVLRRRNMPEERQREAPKWQRAVRTVEWLAAQLPLEAEFQLFTFNETADSLIEDSEDDWVPMADGTDLDRSIRALRTMVPKGGTSLENLALKLRSLSPIPDNVYLIIDSLPTQGTSKPRRATVSGKERLDLFRDAVGKLPRQIPINVIMFPMEGDPMAAAAYWNLARVSNGSFVSPSWDWP